MLQCLSIYLTPTHELREFRFFSLWYAIFYWNTPRPKPTFRSSCKTRSNHWQIQPLLYCTCRTACNSIEYPKSTIHIQPPRFVSHFVSLHSVFIAHPSTQTKRLIFTFFFLFFTPIDYCLFFYRTPRTLPNRPILRIYRIRYCMTVRDTLHRDLFWNCDSIAIVIALNATCMRFSPFVEVLDAKYWSDTSIDWRMEVLWEDIVKMIRMILFLHKGIFKSN